MSSHNTFVRKIMYGVAICVLLMPLYMLSHPATNAVKGVQGSPGGKLAQLRDQYRLSQAQLGQIDPTSVTIKLATLGMRGVAANILWDKANDFYLKKDWANRAATLNQITKVQPNFVNVWLNQAWNVSYNIAVQFDDYRERYRWIIKGFDFLKEGIQHNERQPRLPWELGWMISQKIGRADEHKQYRKLFHEDQDFHGSRPLALRDNWLVGKEWFERAVEMVDTLGVPLMGKSSLYYRSSSPMCQISYSDDLENDGTFGEVAKRAWGLAANEWRRYGDVSIETSFRDPFTQEQITLRLNDKELCLKNAIDLTAQLDALQPGLRDKLVRERMGALSPGQREALDTPAEKRTARQIELAMQATEATRVTHDEVAHRVTGTKRKDAIQLAKEIVRNEQLADHIESQRDIVNFAFWRMRADLEQGDDILTARMHVFQGDRAGADNDLVAARNAYEQGILGWQKVLNKEPSMASDAAAGDDLMKMIRRYHRILSQLDEPFPEKFILQDVIDAHNSSTGEPPKSPAQDSGPAKEPGRETAPASSGSSANGAS